MGRVRDPQPAAERRTFLARHPARAQPVRIQPTDHVRSSVNAEPPGRTTSSSSTSTRRWSADTIDTETANLDTDPLLTLPTRRQLRGHVPDPRLALFRGLLVPVSTGQRRLMQPVMAAARAAAQRAAAARPERFGDAFLNVLQLQRVQRMCQGAVSAAAAAQQSVERGEARRLPPTNAAPIAAVRVGFDSVSRARSGPVMCRYMYAVR